MSISGRLRRHAWRRALTGPYVIGTGLLAAAGLTAVAVAGWNPLQLLLIPAAAAAGGLFGLTLLGRYISQRGRFHREALDQARRDLATDGRTTLAILREYLMLTGDRALQKAADALLKIDRRLADLKRQDPGRLPVDTGSTLAQLRDAAVGLLVKCAQLKEHKRQLVRAEAQQTVEDLGRELLDSARDCIDRLDETLDGLQLSSLKHQARTQEDVAALRGELDAQLEVARRVEDRMEKFEENVSTIPERKRH